jgi:hypothetical protein
MTTLAPPFETSLRDFFPKPPTKEIRPPAALLTKSPQAMAWPPALFVTASDPEAARIRRLGFAAVDGTDAGAVVIASVLLDTATVIVASELPASVVASVRRTGQAGAWRVPGEEIAAARSRRAIIDIVGAAVASEAVRGDGGW